MEGMVFDVPKKKVMNGRSVLVERKYVVYYDFLFVASKKLYNKCIERIN